MPNDTQRIEIITGRGRRRRYTVHEKMRFVEETMQQPGITVSAAARMAEMPNVVFRAPS